MASEPYRRRFGSTGKKIADKRRRRVSPAEQEARAKALVENVKPRRVYEDPSMAGLMPKQKRNIT